MPGTQKLLFLNSSHPSSKSADLKRIRSHLATIQHQRRQISDSIWLADLSTTSESSPESVDDADDRAEASDAPSGSEDGEIVWSSLNVHSTEDILRHRQDLVLRSRLESAAGCSYSDFEGSDFQDIEAESHVEIVRRRPRTQITHTVTDFLHTGTSGPFSPSLMPLQRYLEDPSDTLGGHLRCFEINVSDALACYEYLVDVQGAEFEIQCGTEPGFLKPRVLPLIHNNPTLIAGIALLCAPLLRFAKNGVWDIQNNEIVRLRHFVLGILQTAIQDPAAAMEDYLLFAIAVVAAFEALLGSAEGCRVHMNGITAIVKMRGGMTNLGIDGMLEYMLRWYDVNIAELLGHQPFTEGMPSSGRYTKPTPRVENFVPFKYLQ